MKNTLWNGWAILLVGALFSATAAQETAQKDAPKTLPVYQDGQAQVVDGFKNSKDWIRHDLWVVTESNTDGDDRLDRVHVSVVRPKQTETEGLKVNVIYNTSPYFSGVAGNDPKTFWNPRHELYETPPEHEHPEPIKHQSRRPTISMRYVSTWVPRGFAVVHSCSPGTGLSQGCPTVGGENESLAPKAVIDWLNGRAKGYTTPDGDEEVVADWCTGNVGMIGTSYNGTLPLAAATTGVDGLKAIIPIAPNTSYYHYYRSYGLIRHPGGYMGEDIDVLYDFINSGDPEKRDHCDCEVRDKLMLENHDRVSGDYNDFWYGRDYLNKVDKVQCAVLMAHAFNDWNVMPEHSFRIYQALKEKGLPVQCYYHQGGHGGDPPLEQVNRWFTRYVCGIENGVENDPKAWIVRESDRRNKPTAYADYPNPEAKPVVFKLGAGGRAKGMLDIDAGGQGIESLTDNVELSGAELAAAPESEHRLLYVTPELKKDLHLSGVAKFKIRMACDKPGCNLSVWMVSLPWADKGRITKNIITRGWADPQNRNSLRKSEPLEPGKFYDVEFDLQPDDQVIPAGQSIGLMIFSSDRDFTLWPKPGTELQVDLSGTTLTLPVVGGASALEEATK